MRHLRRIGWMVALLALGLLTIKSFVGDVYRISSPSMEPTLRTGEWVFVRFDRSPPERGEIVVLEKRGEMFVKRAMGLGGEGVQVKEGDLRVDGELLSERVEAACSVLMYDQAIDPDLGAFQRGNQDGDPWHRVDGVWRLDGQEIERGSQAGLLRYVPEVLDYWLGGEAEHEGLRDVNDVRVAFEVRVMAPEGRLHVVLFERGDRFDLVVELGGESAGQVSVSQRNGRGKTTLGEHTAELPVGSWVPIEFANVDDHLMARIGDRPAFVMRSQPGEFHTADVTRQGQSFGHRVMLGGEGCRLEVRGIQIHRDFHYESIGDFGVARELVLGSDQLFLLGDNSRASRDGRMWGPVGLEDVIGRATRVVWPPRAWRSLDR